MISLKKITISFNQRVVLNNINLDLPKTGFYALLGKSGSGKTTLLNILAGIETSYQGTYCFHKKDLGRNKEFLTSFRLLNIGYLFQDFRLFENETVFNNVLLPLEVATNETFETKTKLIKHLLNLVGLSSFRNKEVRHLSGGEKQRVALVRALVNRPQIILCDEATGALDQNTAKEIMLILVKLSKHYLIIFASHDENLVNAYCQVKLLLKAGSLKKIDINNNQQKKYSFAFPLLKKKQKNFVIPLVTKIKRAISIFKIRKTRLILNNLIMSLGLFGSGLALLLTTSMNEKIQESFTKVMKQNMIVMSAKEDLPLLSRKYSANLKNVELIQERYASFVEYIGVSYQTSFESFFPHRDELFISSTTYKIILPRFSSRQFNDFFVLGEKEDEGPLYPNYKVNYNNDEIVIGLPYNDMFALCYSLKIERSYLSLGQYIKSQSPLVTFGIANNDWQYDDEQIFYLSGVMETDDICLFHSNPLWSEYVFEEKMLLPSIDHFQPSLPWEISKTYYLKCYLDPSFFLEKTISDPLIKDFLFECASQKHFPTHTLKQPTKLLNRLLVYHLDYKYLDVSLLPNLVKKEKSLKNFYYTSDKGYYYHPNSFLIGFAQNVFVSLSSALIESVIDLDTFMDETFDLIDNLPKGIILGNLQTSLNEGLLFSSNLDTIIYGSAPSSFDEIVISEGLMKKLFMNKKIISQTLHVATHYDNIYYSQNKIEKLYSTQQLKIVGVSKGDNISLHHRSSWPIVFFQTKANIDPFSLVPKHVVFEANDLVKTNETIGRLINNYPQFIFSNPIEKMNKSLNETMSLLRVSLFVFACLALLTSFFLFFIVIYVTIEENAKDINLYFYLGINRKEIRNSFLISSFLLSSLSFFIASIETIFADFLLNHYLSNYFMSNISFRLDIRPLILIFTLSFTIAYFATRLAFSITLEKNKKSLLRLK